MSATPAAPTEGGTPSNVLLLAPPFGQREERLCGELLRPPTDGQFDFVFCCLGSPAEKLDDRVEHAGIEPASTTVVDVDAAARSAAAASAPDHHRSVDVERIQDPGDLLAIGRALSGRLDGEGDPVVCVDSLTDLLQYSSDRELFRFLDVLTDAVERSGGIAHYHMDPEAHDPETIRTLEVQFDAVIDPRESRDRTGEP